MLSNLGNRHRAQSSSLGQSQQRDSLQVSSIRIIYIMEPKTRRMQRFQYSSAALIWVIASRRLTEVRHPFTEMTGGRNAAAIDRIRTTIVLSKELDSSPDQRDGNGNAEPKLETLQHDFPPSDPQEIGQETLVAQAPLARKSGRVLAYGCGPHHPD